MRTPTASVTTPVITAPAIALERLIFATATCGSSLRDAALSVTHALLVAGRHAGRYWIDVPRSCQGGAVDEPVEDGQQDAEEEQHSTGPLQHDLFAGALFRLVDWPELAPNDLGTSYPVIETWWQGRPVYVVKPETIQQWSQEWQAVVLRSTAATTTDGPAHAVTVNEVDLPRMFRDTGLLSDTVPDRALVIEDSQGIQVGHHNHQVNVHRFQVKDVRISLDRAFQRELTRIEAIHAPAHHQAVKIAAGRPARVVVRNAQGIQIGDHNTQRNHFTYVIRGPSVTVSTPAPADLDRIVNKLRDHRVTSAQKDLTAVVRDELRREVDRLYDTLPGEHNVHSDTVPKTIRNVTGGQYGPASNAAHHEQINVSRVDITPLDRAVRRDADLATHGTAAKLAEAAQPEKPATLEETARLDQKARPREIATQKQIATREEPAGKVAELDRPAPKIHRPGRLFGL